MVFVAWGEAGSLAVFDGRYLTLCRKGVGVVAREEHRVNVSQIIDVEWKSARLFTGGFVRFVVPGSTAWRSPIGNRVTDARRDDWAVTFRRKAQPQFAHLRAAVERSISGSKRGRSQILDSDVLDQLQWLDRMRGSGALSEAQFYARQRELLEG